MILIKCRNVNDALPVGLAVLKERGELVAPRSLQTLEADEPVATVYTRPTECVLFDQVRDANPWLHIFDALAVLGGLREVEWLAQFTPRMREFSDDGKIFHAAYGYRLRHHFGQDQLQTAVKLLRCDHTSRQATLQIWSAADDLGASSKDLPCNTTIHLLVRNGRLRMTVYARSNDVLWGAYGANAVQFSFLLQFLAAQVGVQPGTYTQVSNSFHAYIERDDWERIKGHKKWKADPYTKGLVTPYSLVDEAASWDEELQRFLADPLDELGEMFPDRDCYWRNRFFPFVVCPLYAAWQAHKRQNYAEAFRHVGQCMAMDWRLACTKWLERRAERREKQDL